MSRRKVRDDTSAPDPQPDPKEPSEKTSQPYSSSNTATDNHTVSSKNVLWRHNYIVHKQESPSPLSSNSNEQNFRGFFNLAGIVLVVSNLRLVLENLLKYGLLINMRVMDNYIDLMDLSWALSLPVFATVALILEKLGAKRILSERSLMILNILNIGSLLIIPISLVRSTNNNLASGIMVLILTVIVWMKLVSYCVVNRENRRLYFLKQTYYEEVLGIPKEQLVTYPNNLTVKDMAYFLLAPTLCYQMNYPRSPTIRWYWLTGKFLQFIFFGCLMIFMTEQYITPTIHNSMAVMNKPGWVWSILERILKLSIPVMLVWLLGFYTFFHLWLNILAELLRFGDRTFYKDWWNSTTLAYYWRTWNIPVHLWLLRHLYHPCLRHGFKPFLATLVIFFVSAVFHEIIVSVPLRTFNLWFFLGMLAQAPMILIGRLFPRGSQIGNIMFWFSFCVFGQPTLLLLYYSDYYQRNFGRFS
jgi:diacylglycerol O-acyltransferase-1